MSRPLILQRRFAPLFVCQFFSALNDNFLKNTLVFLILAAVIIAAIAFSVDRSTSVVDPVPAAIEPAAPEPSTTAPAPTETAPADTEGTGTGTTTPATPAPDTGGTTAPAP